MNSTEIFSLALGLQEPWFVENVSFNSDGEKRTLDIKISHKVHDFWKDKNGKSTIYDHVERTWKHLNFFQHECYIHCNVPRLVNEDGKVLQVEVPWARAGSGFTLLFEAFSMLLIEQEMPVNKVAGIMGEYPQRVWNFFRYWLSIAYQKADHKDIKVLGIDETSTKKGHNYVTIAVDMDERRVVHATPGKGAETITKIADYLEEKGTEKDTIEQVCIDLSPSFISGVQSEFKNAAIVFDRYHLKAQLNKAFDELRIAEAKSHSMLKGHKYVFLKSNKNLSDRQKEDRHNLITLLPNIGEAYRLKVLFDDFWDLENVEDSESFLAYWCDLVIDSNIRPLIKFTNLIKSHWSGIVNYTKYKITNGILEGTNSKIQLAKNRARGYRNIDNFISMIYFLTAKLKFNYPQYST
jgi:transposase